MNGGREQCSKLPREDLSGWVGNTGEHIIPLKRNIIDDLTHDIVFAMKLLNMMIGGFYISIAQKRWVGGHYHQWRSWL